jgi:hypothetical protein
MEMFNLKELHEADRKEKYCVDVPNRFAALVDFDTEVEIHSSWEMISKNIIISAKESMGLYDLKKKT